VTGWQKLRKAVINTQARVKYQSFSVDNRK
jgi:hypothetical protein